MSALAHATSRYGLELARDGLTARLSSPTGERWASLRLLAALDTTDGPDETLSVATPREVGQGEFEIERRSTRWEQAMTRVTCSEDGVELTASVRGRGDLVDVHLLGGRSLIPGLPTGFLPSGSAFETLFSPNPSDPGRLVQRAAETAVVGVCGDGEPGRGRWFFTPAPLSLWLTSADVDEPSRVDGGWVGISLAAPVEQLTFVQLAYVPVDRAFNLRLEYEGHTRVAGAFEAPAVTITAGVDDPYTGLQRHRNDLAARGAAPAVVSRDTPSWWRSPIFCGWGAQCHLARTNGASASDFASQQSYDGFLEHLERQGIVPRTIVIDDKWQAAYGTNEPDPAKWPDLRGWIARRHERGQRVLLWWKAWDPEGLPADHCIRNADGAPVAFDPTGPRARELLTRIVRNMIAGDGLDADGLKVDFTARTPSGAGLTVHAAGWGIALLHDLLALVHRAAKEAKDDALLITQTPHPAFADVTDMVRLNDMLRLEDDRSPLSVVRQMRYRADVVRAACPELLVDTDDWCAPSLAEWRAYLAAKPSLGVPSLYYAEALDLTGEAFQREDYDALRRAFA